METTFQSKSCTENEQLTGGRFQKISPFLWFDKKAEEAMKFYTGIFKNSEIAYTRQGPDGKLFTGSFLLNGYEFMVLNAGPMFSFSPAISFFVNCESEQETDRLWQLLSAE